MRTTSRTRALRRFFSLRGVALLALLVVALLAAALWRAPLSGFLWRALTPVLAARNALERGEVARLRGELQSAQARSADRDVLYRENLELKALLGRDANRAVMLTGVIARPPGLPYDTLMLDAGIKEGLAAGDLISAGGSVIIGSVAQVYPTSARVVLFSAPGVSHDALLSLSDDTVIPLTLQGQGAGGFIARVPAGTRAQVGNSVVLPGISSGMFATVSAVEIKEGESFETLYLHLPVDPFALRYVEVWRSSI